MQTFDFSGIIWIQLPASTNIIPYHFSHFNTFPSHLLSRMSSASDVSSLLLVWVDYICIPMTDMDIHILFWVLFYTTGDRIWPNILCDFW